MTIQDLGALGEFIGSLVVLVTLIYIAIQARESRSIAAAESVRQMMASFSEVNKPIQNDEMAKLIRIGLNDWKRLTRNEQARVHIFFLDVVTHYANSLEQQSLPGMSEWVEVFENNVLGMITTPGGSEWWNIMKPAFADKMQSKLVSRLADQSSLPPAWPAYMPWFGSDD